MQVGVAEAKNKLTQLIAAVERGERVTISRRGEPVVEIVRVKRPRKFGTLKGKFQLSEEQFHQLTRPLTEEEAAAFLQGNA